MKKIRLVIFFTALFCGLIQAQNRQVSPTQSSVQNESEAKLPTFILKTNLLYGAGTLTPNLAMEFGLGRRTSFHIGAGYNPWNLDGSWDDNTKLVHWLVRPEVRYWFAERFKGHFVGIHGLYSNYNVSKRDVPLLFKKEFRYEGFAAGGGISYGYLWNWSRHWGMEFTVGVGAAHLQYDKYDCVKCGRSLGNSSKTYFGPTNAGITLVYKIGRSGKAAAKRYDQNIDIPEIPPVEQAVVEQPQAEYLTAQPEPELVVEPVPTTGERLSQRYSFIAPNIKNDYSAALQSDVNQLINNNRKGSLSVYFRQGSKVIDSGYRENDSTLTELVSVVRAIQESSDSRVACIVIAGFASPEGKAEVNSRLARERAEVIKEFLTNNAMLGGADIHVYKGGVDWHGLRRLVAQSDIPEKHWIMNIIDHTPIWDAAQGKGRHGELMRLRGGKPYRYMMKNLFPELRNATYIRVYYENKPQ